MRIGILTFHRAHNYGAVLQCYALQSYLESLGHEVYVIDYRQPFVEVFYRSFTLGHLLKKNTIRALWYIIKYPIRVYTKRKFEKFVCKYLNTTSACTQDNIPDDFDAYIIGSDQLWGIDCLGGKKDEIYLGNFKRKSHAKVIGYAISTNINSLHKLQSEGLFSYIRNFTHLSMREQFAIDFISSYSNIYPKLCLDPTLITEQSIWEPLIDNKWEHENYVLIYQVRYPKGDSKYLRNKALDIAKELKCKVIDASNKKYTVEDFISLIKYARLILTTSFHATVFSVIFEKQFYSIKLNDGHDDRYASLLSLLHLENRCVDMNFKVKDEKIDYTTVRLRLVEIQKDSQDFLSTI